MFSTATEYTHSSDVCDDHAEVKHSPNEPSRREFCIVTVVSCGAKFSPQIETAGMDESGMFTGTEADTTDVSNEKNLKAVPAAQCRTVPEINTPIPDAELQSSVVDEVQLDVMHMVWPTKTLGVESHGAKFIPGTRTQVPPDGEKLYLKSRSQSRVRRWLRSDGNWVP